MISIVLGIYTYAGTIPDDIRPATFEYVRRLIAVAMAHQFEYAFGAFTTVGIALLTWRRTERPGTKGLKADFRTRAFRYDD